MARKVYASVREYLLTEHAAAYSWVFEIEELAKRWPNYTPEVGRQAQADVIEKAVRCAIRIDRNNGDEILITGRPVTPYMR